jgi:hypothetical protein
MAGTELEKRVLARLDFVEANVLPPDPDPRYGPGASGLEAALARQEAQQKAEAERVQAYRGWQEDRLVREAAAREEIRLKNVADQVDRKTAGVELAAIRAKTGLTLFEMSLFVRLPADMLGRVEKGVPVGGGWSRVDEIRAGYELALKVTAEKPATPAKAVKS